LLLVFNVQGLGLAQTTDGAMRALKVSGQCTDKGVQVRTASRASAHNQAR
jgi:hypothetical protein